MLLVDERIGSRDLLQPLQRLGVPCELQRLEYGDFAFIGRGLEGQDIFIGIELKETRDLIASLRSSRFAGHQLPGLQTAYDRAWLLTEGIWRAGEEGVLEVMAGGWKPVTLGKQRIMARDLESWILTQTIRGGISHWHSPTRRDTLRFLSTLFHWWTDKDLDEHRSHAAIYLPPPDRAMLIEPSTFVKMASCLPNVGWEKAGALEDDGAGFTLVHQDSHAPYTAEDLRGIPGIGPTIAKKVLSALHQSADGNEGPS